MSVRLPFGKKAQQRAVQGRFVVPTKAGSLVVLRRPLGQGGLTRRRAKNQPLPYWRNIVPSLVGQGQRGFETPRSVSAQALYAAARFGTSGRVVPEGRINGWLLVLAAKRIPHTFFAGAVPRLYVPVLSEKIAQHEITAFENERPALLFAPPAYNNVWAVVLLLLALCIWHGLRVGWFYAHLPIPPFPVLAADWPASFGLDIYRTRVLHQWWRAVTALCIHSDNGHLAANVGFGLVFLTSLFRRSGAGLGFALTIGAGVFGNVGNAFFREAHVLSMGFSTALFGAMGSLCALSAMDTAASGVRGGVLEMFMHFARKSLLPVGAGLALLGLLGGGGEPRTDYAAHIWGFAAGVVLGCLARPLDSWIRSAFATRFGMIQAGMVAGTVAFLAGAWYFGLRG